MGKGRPRNSREGQDQRVPGEEEHGMDMHDDQGQQDEGMEEETGIEDDYQEEQEEECAPYNDDDDDDDDEEEEEEEGTVACWIYPMDIPAAQTNMLKSTSLIGEPV